MVKDADLRCLSRPVALIRQPADCWHRVFCVSHDQAGLVAPRFVLCARIHADAEAASASYGSRRKVGAMPSIQPRSSGLRADSMSRGVSIRRPTARAAFRPRCGARSREPIRAPRDGKLRSVLTGCGAAWLARLLWEQEAPGSNPGIPTKRSPSSDVLAGRPCGSGGSVSNFASGSSPVRALCDPGRCWDSLVPVPGRQVADAVR